MRIRRQFAQVLGSIRPGYLRVIVGYGLLDGGALRAIAVEQITIELRIPNCKFLMIFEHETGDVVRIEPLPPEMDWQPPIKSNESGTQSKPWWGI